MASRVARSLLSKQVLILRIVSVLINVGAAEDVSESGKSKMVMCSSLVFVTTVVFLTVSVLSCDLFSVVCRL